MPTPQPLGRISRLRLQAVGAVLASAVMLLPTSVSAQSAQSWTLVTLHAFGLPPDGAVPNGVIRDKKGNLYGTTVYGGKSGHWGAVFALDHTGKERVVHNFRQGPNGYYPASALIFDGSGAV